MDKDYIPELIKDQSVFNTEDEAVEYYFNYYLKNGYPNYNRNDYDIRKELEKICSVSDESLIKDGCIKQTMHGCGFLFSYFPHWVNVRTFNSNSLMDNWNDATELSKLIRKTVRYNKKHSSNKWTTNRLRQNAKVYCAKQSPSNFRPTAAKYLYNTYGNNGNVYDPCGGWGGRMLGFIDSGYDMDFLSKQNEVNE